MDLSMEYEPKGPGEYTAEEVRELVALGSEHHWVQNHLSADVTAGEAFRIMVRGEGCYIEDIEGNRYIDAMAGLFLLDIGHGRTEVIDAITKQLHMLEYVNSGAYSTVPAILLAAHIASKAPGTLSRVFFCGGGSEAVEIALKMAKQYHFEGGKMKKTKIISRRGQYHGSTYAAMSVGGKAQYKGAFDPMMPGVIQVEEPNCYRCPFQLEYPSCEMQCVKAIKRVIDHEGADTVAAFIAAPATSGSQIPPPEYWPAVRELCTENDVLLIADEVITGYGRLGAWFGMEVWGVAPDIMTNAKALTSGYLPVGAVVAAKAVAERFTQGSQDTFMHGVTYGSHPGVMAGALAVQQIIEREGLVENSARMGRYLHQRASELGLRHPSVGFAGGGQGLLMSIEMVKNRRTREKFPGGPRGEYATLFTERLRANGIASRGGDSVVLSPPLTVDEPIVDEVVRILDVVIGQMEEDYPVEEPWSEPAWEYGWRREAGVAG
jgi:adenosylmethionine-8-amino-7-oxononanoate aminotransferase